MRVRISPSAPSSIGFRVAAQPLPSTFRARCLRFASTLARLAVTRWFRVTAQPLPSTFRARCLRFASTLARLAVTLGFRVTAEPLPSTFRARCLRFASTLARLAVTAGFRVTAEPLPSPSELAVSASLRRSPAWPLSAGFGSRRGRSLHLPSSLSPLRSTLARLADPRIFGASL